MWLVWLTYADKQEYAPLIGQIKEKRQGLSVAEMVLEGVSRDPDTIEMFRSRKKSQMDYEHGMIVSRDERKAEGRVEGKIATALAMLADKLDISRISRYTGLSISEIEKLQQDQ